MKPVMEMLAPNGAPLGDSVEIDGLQFAAFYRWLAENGKYLNDGPPKGDCPEITQMLFMAWREKYGQAAIDAGWPRNAVKVR